MTKTITCIDCGVEFEGYCNRKRCAACAKVAESDQRRAWRLARDPDRGSVTCVDCGTRCERRSSTHKRCADCGALHRRAQMRRYERENRSEARLERSREWKRNNRVSVQEYGRRWERENPRATEKSAAARRRRDQAIDASRSGRNWTPEEDAVVLSWAEGLRELAAALNRTRMAVTQRRRMLRRALTDQTTTR